MPGRAIRRIAANVVEGVQWTMRGARVESGQALVEYALILAFIALVCIGVVTLFGQTIRDSMFTPILGAF